MKISTCKKASCLLSDVKCIIKAILEYVATKNTETALFLIVVYTCKYNAWHTYSNVNSMIF